MARAIRANAALADRVVVQKAAWRHFAHSGLTAAYERGVVCVLLQPRPAGRARRNAPASN